MCEKAISRNLLEADRMIKACKEANVAFGVIVICRYFDAAEKIKKALMEKRLGKILLVTLTGKSFRSDEYYASGDWRGTWWGEGGGGLMSQTIHYIDLMLYFIGEIDSLSGRYMTTIHKDIEVDDMAVAQFKFKNGAIGAVDSSTAVKPGYPRTLAIHGEKGTIILEEHNIIEWKVEGMNEEDFVTKEKEVAKTITKPGYVDTSLHRLQLLDFMKAISEGKKQRFDATEGRLALEFIRAIYQSGDTGKEVKFPVIDKLEYGKETRM
jgi:predicted dehydrogenase